MQYFAFFYRFNSMSGNTIRKKTLFELFLFKYTILFFVCVLFCFLDFFLRNKAFLRTDGLIQHLTALAYIGKYIREIIKTVCTTGKFIIPQWDFSLGLGADVITTLHYYGLGDVLNLFSVFVPVRHTEILYNVLIFLRLYVSGITFIVYCRHHQFSSYSILCGVVVYVFCGFSFYCAPRHPFFINPMIYLPLMCLGIDFIFERKSPVCFILSSFFACCASFYFFYVLTILVFIYALIRYFFITKEKSLLSFSRLFFSTAACYILAICMSALIFFPNVAGFLTSSRNSFSEPVPVFYKPFVYIKLFLSLVTPMQSFSYTELGFAAPVFLSLIVLSFWQHKKTREIKIFLLICALFISFPFFGHMMNGFNYVTNRWCFAISFVISISFVCVLENIEVVPKRALLISFITGISISSVFVVLGFVFEKIRSHFLASYGMLFISSLVFYVFYRYKRNLLRLTVLPLCVFSVAINSFVKYSSYTLDYLDDFYPIHEGTRMLENSTDKMISKLANTSDFYRYEEEEKLYLNLPSVYGMHGTSYYWSQNSGYLSESYNDFELCTGTPLLLDGFNRRTYLQDLFCEKYIILPDSETSYTPYDTIFLGKKNVGKNLYNVYEREKTLPFGYTYKTVIDGSAFSELSALEKQVALMHAAVVQDNDMQTPVEKQNTLDFSSIKNLNFEIETAEGIEFSDKKITVSKEGAVARIHFNSQKNSEVYLEFTDLFFLTDPSEKVTVQYKTKNSSEKAFEIKSMYKHVGHDFLLCSGYSENEINSFTLSFPQKGTYKFSDINVYALSLSERDNLIADLTETQLDTIHFDKNHLTASAKLTEPRLLCLSIPYSDGWTAFVDGKKTPLYRTNVFLTGMYLDEGEHTIVLEYHTPLFLAGSLITFIAWILFVAVRLCFLRKFTH